MINETVVFDGDCGVCTALKNWVEKRDEDGRLRFVGFQDAHLEQVAASLTYEMASQALTFVRHDGRLFRGARGAFEILRRLPGALGWLGSILSFPLLSLAAEPFYRLFASQRGRVSQWLGLDRCGLDDAEFRSSPG